MNRLTCMLASASLLAAMSTSAAVTVGYDADDLTPGPTTTWSPGTNTTAANFDFTAATTATVNAGATNFANVNQWVSTPDFSLINSDGGASFHNKIGSGPRDASWEMVLRPTTFADTGLRTLFNTGGDGRGLAIVIQGSDLTFRFQDNPNANESVFVTVDLATLGTADDFYHFVGLVDLQGGSATPATGTVYINNTTPVSVTSTDPLGDTDGGDLAELGKGNNIPTAGLNDDPTANFLGDIALFNFYDNQLLTAQQVEAQYNTLIPEPGTLALMAIGGLCMARRRRPRA